ncbi:MULTISPECIES: hypothetical protein [Chloracidobacterium]|jgi:hypothetical protein|nr:MULTISPECIES: hypothetical protein [Chloracidobacterium]QUV84827.1 hypothetical protein J8C03_00610 [Chloracidobacterium sp. 2]QUV88772.1 hypothetical protein J8C07_05545 [Chloracidobacterium sp. S]QUV91689.1 hypothetical protein J8C04_04675 [Chloracidobacterium sp. A]
MPVIEFVIYVIAYVAIGFLFVRFGLRTSEGPLTTTQALKIALPVGVAMAIATVYFSG